MANYSIPAGDDRVIVHDFKNNGAAFNLTGSSIYWRLFTNPDDVDSAALYTRTWITGTETGLTLTDPETATLWTASQGRLFNLITDTITLALTTGKTYFYELKLIDGNALVTTLDTGTLTITSSPGQAAGGVSLHPSLITLRRRLADRFDDYTPLVATAAGNVGKTTLIDTANINAGEQHYNGAQLYCTSGVNNALVRTITGTADSTGTLTVHAALTLATASGDTFDVYNRTGRKFKKAQYDRAINTAIDDSWPMGVIEVTANVTTAFAQSTPEVTVPSSISEVTNIEAKDSDGDWHVIPRSRSRGGDGWYSDPSSGQVRIAGYRAWAIDTLSLRVMGYGRQSNLVNDSDSCILASEFVIARAAYHLALANVGQEDMAVRVNIFRDESERARVRIAKLRAPWSQKVRSS